jgi:glycosyltransferase involved in cell wall biosynthesis
VNKPLASCICVTYDRPELLKELLYCFLNQDFENKELIIVNDQENIEYSFDDPRVKIFNLNDRFISLGAKRNFCRDKFNGDFVFFMDDDDIYYTNHLSRHINYHLQHIDYDIITNKNCDYSENDENITKTYINVPFNGTCIKADYVKTHYFPHYVSCGEDRIFIEDAKILIMEDDIPTFHYRWNTNIFHVSGYGNNGIETYDLMKILNNTKEFKKITLVPELTEQTKMYYK